MKYEEYKNHLQSIGPMDDLSKGLLTAFELGYAQGLSEHSPYPYGVLFAVEQAIENGSCFWEIEQAFDDFEDERKRLNNK